MREVVSFFLGYAAGSFIVLAFVTTVSQHGIARMVVARGECQSVRSYFQSRDARMVHILWAVAASFTIALGAFLAVPHA